MGHTEVLVNCSLVRLHPLIFDSQGFGQCLREVGSRSGWVPEWLAQSMLMGISGRSLLQGSMTNLRMGAPGFIGRPKRLVNLHDGSIHGNLLNNLTGNIDIVLGQQ